MQQLPVGVVLLLHQFRLFFLRQHFLTFFQNDLQALRAAHTTQTVIDDLIKINSHPVRHLFPRLIVKLVCKYNHTVQIKNKSLHVLSPS